jgi:flagellar assembly protein FliH
MLKPVTQIVAEAEQQLWAKEEVEAAKAQARADGKQEGFHLGYLQGKEKGLRDGIEEGQKTGMIQATDEFNREHDGLLTMFANNLQGLVDEFQQQMDQWFIRSEEQLAALALEIARRALAQELTHTRESILTIAKEALLEVRSGTSVRVRVNPVDASVLESRKGEILQSVSTIQGIEIVSDDNVLTGCLVESDGGVIDARIETYLERLSQQVRGEAA